MPIVDISGLSPAEGVEKRRIRRSIQQFYHERLGVPLTATTVTFIEDESDKRGSASRHVMARLYSKKFMTMEQTELDKICDTIIEILEVVASHKFNEAFVIPVLAMRGGTMPYTPSD